MSRHDDWVVVLRMLELVVLPAIDKYPAFALQARHDLSRISLDRWHCISMAMRIIMRIGRSPVKTLLISQELIRAGDCVSQCGAGIGLYFG